MRQRTALVFGLLLLLVIAIVRAVEENLGLLKQPFYIFGTETKVSTALGISLFLGFFVFVFVALALGLGRLLNYWVLKLRERAAKESETRYLKGMDAVLGARPLEAIKHFKEAITLNPRSLPALIKMGDALREVGRIDEAIHWHQKALVENPKHMQALYAIVEDYLKKGNAEEAKKWLGEIISLQPKRALHALRLLRNIYIKEQNWYRAKEVQHKILKASVLDEERREDDIFNASIDYQIYAGLLEQKRLDEALLGFEAIRRAYPAFLPTYLRMAEVSLLEGDEESALRNYREGYLQTSSVVPLLFMEKLLLEKGEPDKAVSEYESVISENPKSIMPKFLLAKLLLRLGFFQKAEAIFNEIESLVPPTPTVEFNLAKINERREEYIRACSHYNEMWRLVRPQEMVFRCSTCGDENAIWKDFCPKCGKWSTYRSDIEAELGAEAPVTEPAYYNESAWREV